jgi:dTDP-4-amino-4,6-dideoxygalactose transaminase
LVERAEIVREKGANRSHFYHGQVDKYSWVDIGSSFLPGEIIAAFLLAQMDEAEAITKRIWDIWHTHYQWLEALEASGHSIPMAAIKNGSARDSAGLMSGIVRNLGLAKAIGEGASAEQGKISEPWRGAGRFVTRG